VNLVPPKVPKLFPIPKRLWNPQKKVAEFPHPVQKCQEYIIIIIIIM
jgi:hypothetical protein